MVDFKPPKFSECEIAQPHKTIDQAKQKTVKAVVGKADVSQILDKPKNIKGACAKAQKKKIDPKSIETSLGRRSHANKPKNITVNNQAKIEGTKAPRLPCKALKPKQARTTIKME